MNINYLHINLKSYD